MRWPSVIDWGSRVMRLGVSSVPQGPWRRAFPGLRGLRCLLKRPFRRKDELRPLLRIQTQEPDKTGMQALS